MPLRIELAPFERMIVGGAAIRNGPRRAEFVIETQTKILRQRDIITETEADTPCKRLYLALEMAYLSDDNAAGEATFMAVANGVMATTPAAAPLIAAIFDHVLEGDFYRALKAGKQLVAWEAHGAAGPGEAANAAA